MAGVNRYTTPREGIVVDPLSVEDYTRAGLIRADNTGRLAKFAAQDLSYDVDAKDAKIIGERVGQLKQGIDKISDDITNNNITDSTYDMVLGLKKNKDKLFGKHGDVTKAQTNLQKKLLWQQQVKELSVKDKWVHGRTEAVLRKGEEGFTGTFNQDGTTNDFEGEYGPGNIDIAARMAEVYGEASKHFTEEELKKYQTGEYAIEHKPGTDGFVLTNTKTGEIAKNLDQLTAAYNTLVAEMSNENTLLGSNVKYFGMDEGANKGKLQKYFKAGMNMYMDTKITPAQTTASFYENPMYDNLRADAAAAGKNTGGGAADYVQGKTYNVTSKLVKEEEQNARYNNGVKYMDSFSAFKNQYAPYYKPVTAGNETKETTEILGYGPKTPRGVVSHTKHMGDEFAGPAVNEILGDEDMMSYFRTTNNPLANVKVEDLKIPLYDKTGTKIIGSRWNHEAVRGFLNDAKDAINEDVIKTVQPVYDRIAQTSLVQGEGGTYKNPEGSGNQSSSGQEEYRETVQNLQATNLKIWKSNGEPLLGKDRDNAIETLNNATKKGSDSQYTKFGDDIREARYATDDKNNFDPDKLGAQLLQVDGVMYLVEQQDPVKKSFAGHTARESEFSNIEYGRSKSILIRINSTGEKSTLENGIYVNAPIVRSAEGEQSPTGYMRLIKDPSTGKVLDRVAVTHEQLRDPWIEKGYVTKPTHGDTEQETLPAGD